jgi:hypothetical protein
MILFHAYFALTDRKVPIELEYVRDSLFFIGLGVVCSFLGLFDFRHKFSLQGWVSLTGLSSSQIGLLGGLLGWSSLSIGGVI